VQAVRLGLRSVDPHPQLEGPDTGLLQLHPAQLRWPYERRARVPGLNSCLRAHDVALSDARRSSAGMRPTGGS
jgi:hypothetical protein